MTSTIDKVVRVEKLEVESGGLFMILKLTAGSAVLRVLLDGDKVDALAAGFEAHAAGLEALRGNTARLAQ